MPYVPNPTQATEPVEGREVVSAAREFRELKGSVNTRLAALQTELDLEETTRASADSSLNVRTTALEQLAFNGSTPGAVVVKEFTATASQTAFTLDFAPISVASIDVHINGVYQHHSTYSVVGAVVTLSTGVAAGDKVEVAALVPLSIGETSAELVEYTPAGTGAVATDVQSALRNKPDFSQVLPPATGGTDTRGVELTFNTEKAVVRYGGSDATPQDDQRNFWRGLPNANSWGNPANVGLYSTAWNRNGASYGSYSNTFGHDCITYGVAGFASGAGSCVGNPDAPNDGSGYCAVAFGKNVLAKGTKSAAFCEETESKGRADFAAGYTSYTGANGIGKFAFGFNAWAGQTNGVDGGGALGYCVVSDSGGLLIGRGINPGSPLTLNTPNIGFGSNVTRPTLELMAGDGTGADTGFVVTRGKTQNHGTVQFALSETTSSLTNGGGGGYGDFHIKPRVAGVMADGWIVDAGRTGGIVSLFPAIDNAMRLGAASYRPEYIFAVNGTINTSDAREKQQIRELSDQERAVARRLKSLVRAFKWNSSVVAKGSNARTHIGVMAQDVKSAFEAEGLVAEDYSILCYDEWQEQQEIKDEFGNVTLEYRPAGNRYGVRYEPLLAFIISAL